MMISMAPLLIFVQACFGVAMLLILVRLVRGPTAQDRVMALDSLYFCATLTVLVQGMRYGHDLYFELALLIAFLGVGSSLAMAKFLLRGEVIE